MKNKITCRTIRNLLYLTEDEMSEQESLTLSSHLESCPSCNKVHQDFLSTRRRSIHLSEYIPEYPDFTLSTVKLIKSGPEPGGLKPAIPLHPILHRTLSWIKYVSGIAAVFLLFLFISEQTLSVRKISALESRIQSTVNPPSPGLIDRMTLARNVFTGKEWTDLADKLNVNHRVTDRYDILRIKHALENRMHPDKTGELAFMSSFRHTSTIKRHAITINNLFK